MKRVLLLSAVFILSLSAAGSAVPSSAPSRIISLAPNMTEILFSLGLGDRIIGVTSYCDYPEEARKKPRIGGMSNPSLEAVISLKPDIVMMTTDGNPKEFEERLRSFRIRTYVSKERRLAELPQALRNIGRALGVQKRSDEMAGDVEARLRRLSAARGRKPARALFIIWPEPLIVAGPGTVIDDAISAAGGENVARAARAEYPKYSLEEIIRRSPDIIFIGRAMGSADMKKVSSGLLNRLSSVPAVKNGRVYFVSDDLYRLGPRTMQGIEEIARLLEGAL